jgi:hypothetical protein
VRGKDGERRPRPLHCEKVNKIKESRVLVEEESQGGFRVRFDNELISRNYIDRFYNENEQITQKTV